MINYKTVIGVGQSGSRLADLYSNKSDITLTFNTDRRDVGGIKLGNDRLITNGGAGQNYAKGLKIWAENREKLERYLEPVENQNVVYFVSAGGGSGSSSVVTFLNILMRQSNKILLVILSPFLKESIPATSNATRVLSRVAEFSNNMSVLLMSNDEIAKSIDSKSFTAINNEIIDRVRMITDIATFHDEKYFTPFAIDDGDHKSVAYSGGFINISLTDLEEKEGGNLPKFSYGNIRESSNVLITKSIYTKLSQSDAMIEGDKLVEVSMKLSSAAKGARVIHGTIRNNNKKFPKYVTIASGLNIDKVFNKLKNKATDSAIKYTDKIKTKESKKLERSEDRILNI